MCRSSGTSGSASSSRKSFLRSVLRKPAAEATWRGEEGDEGEVRVRVREGCEGGA